MHSGVKAIRFEISEAFLPAAGQTACADPLDVLQCFGPLSLLQELPKAFERSGRAGTGAEHPPQERDQQRSAGMMMASDNGDNIMFQGTDVSRGRCVGRGSGARNVSKEIREPCWRCGLPFPLLDYTKKSA